MRRLLGVLALCATSISAQPLDTAQAFEDYVGGKTVFFHQGDGRVYAAETYLRDRKVRWSLLGGACLEGEWWAQDGKICFVYENNPDPLCWSVEITPQGLTATSDTPMNPLRLFEAVGATGEQLCQGPKVGV